MSEHKYVGQEALQATMQVIAESMQGLGSSSSAGGAVDENSAAKINDIYDIVTMMSTKLDKLIENSGKLTGGWTGSDLPGFVPGDEVTPGITSEKMLWKKIDVNLPSAVKKLIYKGGRFIGITHEKEIIYSEEIPNFNRIDISDYYTPPTYDEGETEVEDIPGTFMIQNIHYYYDTYYIIATVGVTAKQKWDGTHYGTDSNTIIFETKDFQDFTQHTLKGTKAGAMHYDGQMWYLLVHHNFTVATEMTRYEYDHPVVLTFSSLDGNVGNYAKLIVAISTSSSTSSYNYTNMDCVNGIFIMTQSYKDSTSTYGYIITSITLEGKTSSYTQSSSSYYYPIAAVAIADRIYNSTQTGGSTNTYTMGITETIEDESGNIVTRTVASNLLKPDGTKFSNYNECYLYAFAAMVYFNTKYMVVLKNGDACIIDDLSKYNPQTVEYFQIVPDKICSMVHNNKYIIAGCENGAVYWSQIS